jgi:hypothetical protein
VDVGDLAHERIRRAVRLRKVHRAPAREERCRRFDPRTHERVALAGPRDRDRDLLQRLERSLLQLRRQRAHQLGAACDAGGDRPDVVEARREREDPVVRDEPVGRLEPDDPAARGGDADRPARVGAERDVGELRDHGRGRPAARTARRPSRRARVRNGAVVRVLRRHAVRELVEVCLADGDVPGSLQPRYGLGGLRRDVVREHGRAVRRPHAGGVEQVLDREPRAGTARRELRDPDPVHHSRSAARPGLAGVAGETCDALSRT